MRKKSMDEEIKALLLNNYESYYRLAYSYVRNQEDAMDIVQESAYRAIKNSSSVKQAEYAATWVYRVVINTALDFIRKNRKETVGIEDVDSAHEDRYMDFDVWDSLEKLDEKDRTIIILRYFEDRKLEDIARIINENVNTVKTRLYRALKKLKIELAG
ncbi:sigma-70 family RNA polymerase sigma factor [Diplocloster agilis]|uniref:Sigma-70 family RNA polymerase sigma factor n=1 Tax=Diplocloster agilis TaxID=2850323 RepID=A0A949NI28_9FIRM|nr:MULTISPECIES: sigma-70 family RNA polymerase sigma factor [Lachnospiraceae]MBU9739263.1 sigma-70 family RNA polymerase sigma factor [Diplocloster agilis]MCU6733234.1 sigma-70 family RNA polymerase sigma factor [Suonthocola fibrivorans]